MKYERMLDGDHQPSEKEIQKTIGKVAPWKRLKAFIEDNYGFAPELVFYGNKYGWTIRYRRSGKTFCSLFPETGAFTALIVLGRQEADSVLSNLGKFDPALRRQIGSAEQKRDGRWLWIRVLTAGDAKGVSQLLSIKKKPKTTE